MTLANSSFMRSTDQGAPVSKGVVGAGITMLDALLRLGYNWQEVTPANLTNATGTATLNLTAHGFTQNQRLWLLGADQAGYSNDAIYATIASANQITFAQAGTPTSPSTASGSTTANGAISSATATSIVVTSATGFPSTGNYPIKIDSEWMLVTGGQGTTTWTVQRGFGGSTAATHLTGATITQKILIGVAPAGGSAPWTKDFTGTNLATFRPSGGARLWVDIDDTQAQYMKVRGYEAMTAVGTGTGPFPTITQVAVGVYNWEKSNATDTTARAWNALVSDRMLLCFVDTTNTGFTPNFIGGEWCFVELASQTKAGDPYPVLMTAKNATGGGGQQVLSQHSSSGNSSYHYCPRSYTGLGTAITVGKYPVDARFSGGLTFPHPPDGGLYITPFYVNESAAISRGSFPGLWAHIHSSVPFSYGDTFSGSGALAGKRFFVQGCYASGYFALEVSNTIVL